MIPKFNEALVEELVEDEEVVNRVLDIIAENDMAEAPELTEALKRIIERWDKGFYES